MRKKAVHPLRQLTSEEVAELGEGLVGPLELVAPGFAISDEQVRYRLLNDPSQVVSPEDVWLRIEGLEDQVDRLLVRLGADESGRFVVTGVHVERNGVELTKRALASIQFGRFAPDIVQRAIARTVREPKPVRSRARGGRPADSRDHERLLDELQEIRAVESRRYMSALAEKHHIGVSTMNRRVREAEKATGRSRFQRG